MRRSNLSTVLYVLLVFLSGGVVGAFAHRLYMLNSVMSNTAPPSPGEWRKAYVERMHSRLSMTPDQLAKLSVILDGTQARGKELRSRAEKEAFDRSRPEMRVIQEEQVQKINEILTEAQRPEYEKFRAELRAEREKKRQLQQKNTPPKPALPPGD